MNWNRNRWLILVLSLIFVALLVTPNVYAEDINHKTGEVNLPGDHYWGMHLALPDGGGIKYTIDANNSINVYLLDKTNLQKYVSGQNFQYIGDGSVLDTRYASVQVYIDSAEGGDYYIVVESANYKPVHFSYNITYGKDVKVSFMDFIKSLFGSFGSMSCLMSGVILLIWLLVLIWVYKDAKRRGKSGVLWFFIVLFLSIIGLIIWLIVRPKKKVG